MMMMLAPQKWFKGFSEWEVTGVYFGGKGSYRGMWVTGSSGPGRGVATCGTVGNMTGDMGC